MAPAQKYRYSTQIVLYTSGLPQLGNQRLFFNIPLYVSKSNGIRFNDVTFLKKVPDYRFALIILFFKVMLPTFEHTPPLCQKVRQFISLLKKKVRLVLFRHQQNKQILSGSVYGIALVHYLPELFVHDYFAASLSRF